MDMTTRIWYHREKGLSDYRIELETIKEYLIDQIDVMLKEIYKEEENAEKKGISQYLINIFTRVLKERKKVLEHLLKEIIGKVNEDNDKEWLFDLLTDFGFEKKVDREKIVFIKDDEVFIYPLTPLVKHHYETTRKQLVTNGWIEDGNEFMRGIRYGKL